MDRSPSFHAMATFAGFVLSVTTLGVALASDAHVTAQSASTLAQQAGI